ncbi:MAG: hypothetical protein AB8G23_12680 [Myxococcota bacterium]
MSEANQPFRITSVDKGIRLEFDVVASRADKQRKLARFGDFEMVCDESAMIGGDDSAPPPLAFFASSIAF